MKIKTGELTDQALNWAVAKCEGFWFGDAGYGNCAMYQPYKYGPTMPASAWKPSTNWSQAGPIIERERITISQSRDLIASIWTEGYGPGDGGYKFKQTGPTPLIAAMRTFVASRLGDEVDVPEELA